MMRKHAFFDIDYTLYDGYLGTDFSMYMVKQGYADQKIEQDSQMINEQFLAGVIDYREAARATLQLVADFLKGKSFEEVRRLHQLFISEGNNLFPWARQLIKLLQKREFEIYLISAAPLPSVEVIAEFLGVPRYYGTTLSSVEGIYTGRLEKVLNYEDKHHLIQELLRTTESTLRVGFGDSLGDVDMLNAMDKAVLYKPKSQELIDIAHDNGWLIADEENIMALAQAL